MLYHVSELMRSSYNSHVTNQSDLTVSNTMKKGLVSVVDYASILDLTCSSLARMNTSKRVYSSRHAPVVALVTLREFCERGCVTRVVRVVVIKQSETDVSNARGS